MHAPLAQLVEQLTLNQWAAGSSPSRCTRTVENVKFSAVFSISYTFTKAD